MKILLFVLHWGYVRSFDRALRELARNGHRIHIAADIGEDFGNEPLVRDLARTEPGISYGWAPDVTDTAWHDLSVSLRHALNYLRYFHPRHERDVMIRELITARTSWIRALGPCSRRRR